MRRPGVSVGALVSAVAFLAAVAGGCSSANDVSTSVPQQLDDAWTAPTVDDRPGVVELLGQPFAFKVTFEEVDGTVVRFESWVYPELSTRVDFIDGEALWTIEIDTVPDDTFFPGWYDPLSFTVAMPRDDVVDVVTAASPAGVEPEAIPLDDAGPEFAGATMLVGDQIILGFADDQLVYVETLPLSPEGTP